MPSRRRSPLDRAPVGGPKARVGGPVAPDEVLLLWRALLHFRSGRDPGCSPTPKGSASRCPLRPTCPRWAEPTGPRPDGGELVDLDQQDTWPCARLLDLLDADVSWLGRRPRRSS